LDVAAHVLCGIELRLLRQVADAQAVGGKRLTEKVPVDAGHDAEQRRLAGAVGAEHPDLRPVEKREIDPAQDLPLGRDDLAQILHDERVFPCHLYMGAPRWPPNPPSFGPPRRSRGAPLFPWGPRDGPQTPHRSGRPGGAGAPLYFTLTAGGPEM